MDRRSTNEKGFVHFGGDIQSGANDGTGIRIGSASTGATAYISAISDDTNATIGIRGQGTGGVVLGAGSAVKGAYSTTFAWSLAALTSGAQGEITLTTSVGGSAPIAQGDLVGMISLGVATAGQDDAVIQDIRWSAVASSVLTIIVGYAPGGGYDRMARLGDPFSEEGIASLWRQSPLRLVTRMRTPLLLLQGEADLRCVPEDNEQLFVALRHLGREVEYVLEAADGSTRSEWRKPAPDVGDLKIRILEVLDGEGLALIALGSGMAAAAEETTRTQARRIEDVVPADAPLLIAGDFNDWRNHADDLLAERLGLVEQVFDSRQGEHATLERAAPHEAVIALEGALVGKQQV